MSQDKEQPAAKLLFRLTDLEILFTHLQRTVHDLDQVVLEQQRQLELLSRQVKQQTAEIATFQTAADERKPEDDKPPHY